jgi:hypothetical protein
VVVVIAKYPVKQILVATDFSGTADAALGIAAQYARALRARLHLLHVFPAIAALARRLGRADCVPRAVAGHGGKHGHARHPSREVIDAVAPLVGAKADPVAPDRILRVDFVGGRGRCPRSSPPQFCPCHAQRTPESAWPPPEGPARRGTIWTSKTS